MASTVQSKSKNVATRMLIFATVTYVLISIGGWGFAPDPANSPIFLHIKSATPLHGLAAHPE